MNIPIPIVCGTTGRSQTVGLNGSCPVCNGRGTVSLVDRYQRFCFCFVPLCKVGVDSVRGECKRCGSILPASIVMNSTGYTHLIDTNDRERGGNPTLHRSRQVEFGPRDETLSSLPSSSNSEGELTPEEGNRHRPSLPDGMK